MEKTFPFPDCWQNESRVQVLLAPFRERTVNPENYDSKMKFWKDTIAQYCFFKCKASFCKQELQQTFTLGHRVLSSSCLDTVIDEMFRLQMLRVRADYEYDPANSWTGWVVNRFWKKPLHWGQNKIKNVLGAPDVGQMGLVEFVHLGVIEKYCKDLQEILNQPPYQGTLHHYEVLRDKVGATFKLSEDCFKMCLTTLFYQHKIGLSYIQEHNSSRMHLVKIPSTMDPNVNITEGETAIHNLQATKNNLLNQLEDLELHIRENEDKARVYIKENKRLLAKTYLRRKHLLEKNHENRSIALHNIEMLQSNVDEAKNNGVILDAYRYGAAALQDALKASNLTYNNVDEVVSEMRETMDNCKELQDSLGNFNVSSHDDDDELERELRELLNDTSDLKTPTRSDAGHNNNTICKGAISHKIEVTDEELLAMLEGLEMEQNTPVKNVSLGATDLNNT